MYPLNGTKVLPTELKDPPLQTLIRDRNYNVCERSISSMSSLVPRLPDRPVEKTGEPGDEARAYLHHGYVACLQFHLICVLREDLKQMYTMS